MACVILPSAEYCFRVARRISLTTRSAGGFWLDDFALIFVPYGHCDETKILPCVKPLFCLKGADGGHAAVHAVAAAGLNENQSTLDLSNGSRIISLPGSEATTRGYSAADLVIVDEASRVTDELVAAIRPSLATTNGRMIALSTPYGRQGWFYKAWTEGQGWERTKVTAYDCGRISREFLEGERAELGEWMFAQEYGCEFTDTDTQFFASEVIERALTDAVEPLFAS